MLIAPHGSYRTTAFMQAAQSMGVDVLLASEGKHSVISNYAEGLHLNFQQQEAALAQILMAADQRPFAAILGTDDSTTALAAAAAQRLGLPHNDPDAVALTQRKDLARARLSGHGVAVPKHLRLDLQEDLRRQAASFSFPAVVKPLALSGSRGVIRVNHVDELVAACGRIENILRQEPQRDTESRRFVLLEEYIPGSEVAVEGLLVNGDLQLLTVFDKPDPLEGPFFEETYYISPSRLSAKLQADLQVSLQAACAAYGLVEGPVHAECRINTLGIWVLEVAARTIGGMCGRLLTVGLGQSLESLVLQHALGLPVRIKTAQPAAGVLMIPIPRSGVFKRVEGILKAQRVAGIDEVNIQVPSGHPLQALPEGGSYLGFIFASGETPAGVEAALRQAHACLHIVIDPLLPVSVTSTQEYLP
ncbi:MAG: ATP-grasp domain-containing protein [Gammaproteobacteria bacterium]